MQMKNLAVLVALPIALVACGGGGGGSSSGGGGITTPGGTINSQFIDASVKGLKYIIGTTSGFTGDNGLFPCKNGEEVTFAVHDKEIGKANCGEKIYISELAPSAGVTSTDFAAALIQSLSKSTGGVLDLTAFNSANISLASIDLSDIAHTENSITALVNANPTLGLKLVTVDEAKEHVAANLPDLASDPVMADLASATTGGKWITLDGVASNSTDSCWENITARVEVQEVAQSGTSKKNYKFNVLAAIGHDDPINTGSIDCNTGVYDCLDTPAPRYFSGRSLSISQFASGVFKRSAGEDMVCYTDGPDNSEDYYYMEEVFEGCKVDELVYKANKSYELPWSGGYLVNINITDTGYSISYKENGTDIQPEYSTFNHEAKTVGLKSSSYNCSYSISEQF